MRCSNMVSSHLVFVVGISLISASTLRRVPLGAVSSPITLVNDPILSSVAENASLRLSTPTITYDCGNGYYGVGAHADSCDEALRTMALVPGPPTQQFTWGERATGQYDMPLPQRWISSDGKCYVEVELARGHLSGRASQSQIVAGGAAVVDGCIRGKENPTGGKAEHINDDNSLSVGVIETSWSFTQCYGSMPPLAEASCRHLLNRMNTEDDDTLFGPRSDPDVEVVLPKSLVSQDQRCALNILAPRGVEHSSWFAIWTAGVEIAGICARQGKAGVLNEIGDRSHLIVQITSPSNIISSS